MGWLVTVNGFGFGLARLDIFPAGFPANPSATAVDVGVTPSAGIPGRVGIRAGAPLPPGADPKTFGFCRGGFLWRISAFGEAWNGDSGGRPDPSKAGRRQVSAQLQFGGTVVSATDAVYSLQWSGSGKGASQSLKWLETTEPFCPVIDQGQLRLPDHVLESAHLLHVEERDGKFSESLQIPIHANHDVNNIVVISEGDMRSSAPKGRNY